MNTWSPVGKSSRRERTYQNSLLQAIKRLEEADKQLEASAKPVEIQLNVVAAIVTIRSILETCDG